MVGEAADGAQGAELAEALQPHSVILDMKMPVMDGQRALALIKSSCPHTDVIALSGETWASGEGPHPDAALEKGGGGWIEKLPLLVELLAVDRAEVPAGA